MGLVASLKCGTDKGQIKGAMVKDGHEGEIGVRSARHQVQSKTSLETGMPKGTGVAGGGRTFADFVITKKIDQASPYFHQALKESSLFTEWRLDFFHIPSNGPEFRYATVILSKAKISSIRTVMPNFGIPANKMVHEYEEVSFQYEGISWGFSTTKGDQSPGSNQDGVAEVNCIPEPDWALQELKVLLLGIPKLIASEKALLWEEWKSHNPGKEVPAEFMKD